MILEIVKYGHPALRQKGLPVASLTPEVRQLVADMFETMHDAHGIGLAAAQVARPLRLALIDVRESTDRPSWLELGGQRAPVAEFMPLVLINPEITPLGTPATGPEGCLSFPELYGDITRPESIDVTARNEKWEPLQFRCGGLLARAIQHEVDHLNGILYIDRMTREKRHELQPELDQLMASTKAALKLRAAA